MLVMKSMLLLLWLLLLITKIKMTKIMKNSVVHLITEVAKRVDGFLVVGDLIMIIMEVIMNMVIPGGEVCHAGDCVWSSFARERDET